MINEWLCTDTPILSGYWYIYCNVLRESVFWQFVVFQDSAVVQDPDGDGKIVYLFLPLYKVLSYQLFPFISPKFKRRSEETYKMP